MVAMEATAIAEGMGVAGGTEVLVKPATVVTAAMAGMAAKLSNSFNDCTA